VTLWDTAGFHIRACAFLANRANQTGGGLWIMSEVRLASDFIVLQYLLWLLSLFSLRPISAPLHMPGSQLLLYGPRHTA